jgi:hypothetical protein
MWPADLAAHHDLHVSENGTIRVLAEVPRRIGDYAMLDNEIVTPLPRKAPTGTHSVNRLPDLESPCSSFDLGSSRCRSGMKRPAPLSLATGCRSVDSLP